ncbi:MAG: AAA family ATPase, partial [Pseudomonadota bacterium]|nr:AAA family ATPase [Pseudomonadota bacterium]
ELLWPGVALDVGRNRLRQALSALRALLQPADGSGAEVLDADRTWVRVHPGRLECDVCDFERQVRAGDIAAAHDVYQGEFMPGFYDEWIVYERRRLADLHEALLAPVFFGPPPPRPEAHCRAGPETIPCYLTRHFGGPDTLERLLAVVQSQRLVTLHGPGGSGKTRLAAQAARCLQDAARRPDDTEPARFELVLYVPLAAAVSARHLLEAVAAAMQASVNGDLRQRLVALLSGRRVLLTLDNAETLDAQADAAIGNLLAALPLAHGLVTSQRLLALDGESVFELDGLAVADGRAPIAGEPEASPAVALFIDRARAARADVRLDREQRQAVVEIVRLLGGMPLAIELAASRIRSLAPTELLQRLLQDAGTPMLDLLARPARPATADLRHASMRHMLDCSWRELLPVHDTLLQRMSVLQAPATLDVLAAVTGMDSHALQLRVDELLDLALVQRMDGGPAGSDVGASAYGLLGPVREYAGERRSPEVARAARSRLRAWLTAQLGGSPAARSRLQILQGPHQQQMMTTAVGDGEAGAALALAVAVYGYWTRAIVPLATVQALEAALQEADDHDLGVRADVLDLLAYARLCQGGGEAALAHAEAALALVPAPDASHAEGVALTRRSIVLTRWAWVRCGIGMHDERGNVALSQALESAERSGALQAQEQTLRTMAMVRLNVCEDFAGAEVLIARCQAIAEGLGDAAMASARLYDRATIWAWTGRVDAAIQVYRGRIRQGRSDGSPLMVYGTLRQLGRVLVRERRFAEAADALREAIEGAWNEHNLMELTHALLHLPDALVHGAQLELAARLQGFASSQFHRLFGTLNRIEARELQITRRLLRLRLGATETDVARIAGFDESFASAVALALSTGSSGPPSLLPASHGSSPVPGC